MDSAKMKNDAVKGKNGVIIFSGDFMFTDWTEQNLIWKKIPVSIVYSEKNIPVRYEQPENRAWLWESYSVNVTNRFGGEE